MGNNVGLIPDDIIVHLFNYVNEEDCMALALSGVCTRFTFLYSEKRKLSISKCYFVTQYSFCAYIDNWICPEQITFLDISHCYWLCENILVDVVRSMLHLKTLYVQDTKINLFHLAKIFETCFQITKLGMNLVEDWDIHESKLNDTFSIGFGKLTHLKVLVFNSEYYIDSWLVILQLLSYSQKCVDLHLEIAYTEDYFRYGAYGKIDYDEEIVKQSRVNYFPHLVWMASLKKLVILKRGSGMSISYPDECLKALIQWILSLSQYGVRFNFERLWVQESKISDDAFNHDFVTSSLKSILLGYNLNLDFENASLRKLEHIGHAYGISEFAWLPNIRYIRGFCTSSQGVDEFCRTHPKLEYLALNDNNGEPFSLQDDWSLKELKVLVYSCIFPDKDVLEKFVSACPNLETLHIGHSNQSTLNLFLSPIDNSHLEMIKFERLTTLTLSSFDLFEGGFFETIFNGCPQLRNLQLCGGFSCVECFDNLCRFLPLVKSLRDFRLQYTDDDGRYLLNVLEVLDALNECKTLARLVLFEEKCQKIPWDNRNFDEFLYEFVMKMKHLVAFGFISAARFDRVTLAELKEKFDCCVLPLRPQLWYYFGPTVPAANDPTVPRIHYDEIVCPINYFETSPPF